MVDMLDRGLAWLNTQRERFAAHTVRYERAGLQRNVKATIGRTVFRLDLGPGVSERVESRDYLISAVRLKPFALPQPGDRIIETLRGQRHTAEVMAPGGEPAWRWSDGDRRVFRIHTKHLKSEAL